MSQLEQPVALPAAMGVASSTTVLVPNDGRAHLMLRSPRSFCWIGLVVLSIAGPAARRASHGPGRRHERGSRAGHSRRRPVPQGTATRPTAPGPRLTARRTCGTTSLVTLALLTAGEKSDSPTIQQSLAFLRRFGPEQTQQHVCHLAANHGLRRRRAGARPCADRGQCRLVGARQTQARRPDPLAGILDLSSTRRASPATTRTPSTRCSA